MIISTFYYFLQHNREDRLSEQGVTVNVNNPGKLLRYLRQQVHVKDVFLLLYCSRGELRYSNPTIC